MINKRTVILRPQMKRLLFVLRCVSIKLQTQQKITSGLHKDLWTPRFLSFALSSSPFLQIIKTWEEYLWPRREFGCDMFGLKVKQRPEEIPQAELYRCVCWLSGTVVYVDIGPAVLIPILTGGGVVVVGAPDERRLITASTDPGVLSWGVGGTEVPPRLWPGLKPVKGLTGDHSSGWSLRVICNLYTPR